MRRACWLLPLMSPFLVFAGCQKDFDTQYAETEQKVKDAEAQIDSDMAREARREPGEKAKSD
jgi:hypothetical protein